MKGLYVALPVFGEPAVRSALRYGLPTLLAPGNLPALAAAMPVKVLLCTTQKDLSTLLASPLIRMAREKMAVRAVPLAADMAELGTRLGRPATAPELLTAGYQYALALAAQDDFGLIGVRPAAVYADGSFAELARLIGSGARAVAVPSVDIALRAVDERVPGIGAEGQPLPVTPRDLARLAAGHPGPAIRQALWDSATFTDRPARLYWRLGGHGFLLRAWHPHPVFVYGAAKDAIKTDIEVDLLAAAASDANGVTVVDDSDRFLVAEVSEEEDVAAPARRADPAAVAAWLAKNTRALDRELVRRPIWIHDGTDRAAWRAIENEANGTIEDILRRYAAGQATPNLSSEQLQDPQRAENLVRGMLPLLESNPAQVAQACIAVISVNSFVPIAYEVAALALQRLGNQEMLGRLLNTLRVSGLTLVERGDVAGGAAFFAALERSFPDICAPYARLFGQISAMTTAYRSTIVAPSGSPPRKRLIVSLAVWGPRYIDLLSRAVIPSLLAPGNIPALTRIREVHFDIYTVAADVEAIRRAPSFQRLTEYAQVNFICFSPDILSSVEYRINQTLRYRTFGAFHHLSFDRARSMGADVMPTNPDCLHSDGAVTAYARFIDQGYDAVLVTAIRGQAEALLPIFDTLRDDKTQALAIPPRKLVELNLRHIHQAHKGFILTKGNRELPPDPSVLFFPYEHGVYVRCFHIHPILLSAAALKKDVRFDYYTVDMNCVTNLFPRVEDWKRMKVLQDSDDAFMMDTTYAYGTPIEPQNREFSLDYLLEKAPGYIPHHHWAFHHRINFHCDATLDGLTVYNRQPDGSLQTEILPIDSRIDLGDEQVAAWLRERMPPPG